MEIFKQGGARGDGAVVSQPFEVELVDEGGYCGTGIDAVVVVIIVILVVVLMGAAGLAWGCNPIEKQLDFLTSKIHSSVLKIIFHLFIRS